MASPAEHSALNLKPRLYYVAKHWWQRSRIARARARTDGDGRWSGVRLLGYHRVSDDDDELAVAPARFAAQMEGVLAAGIEPLPLERAVELLESGAAADGRYLVVTFDDGYRDNLDEAAPILRRLGIPATIFVPTAVIEGEARLAWYRRQPPLLHWDELRDLAEEPLFEVGAHSRTHPSLPGLDEPAVRAEIAGCKRDLEERLGLDVRSFCYPAGRYTERETALVAGAGFRTGVTCDPGVNRPGQPLARLRRTMVDRRDDDDDFAAKLAGLLDTPSPLWEHLHRRRSRPEMP